MYSFFLIFMYTFLFLQHNDFFLLYIVTLVNIKVHTHTQRYRYIYMYTNIVQLLIHRFISKGGWLVDSAA